MTEYQTLKQLLEKVEEDLKTKASSAEIAELKAEINKKDEKITELSNRVEALESDVSVLRNTVQLLNRKADDNEQYSRKMSLRINGIPSERNEGANTCIEKVLNLLNSLPEVNVLDSDIDRAHRVGKGKNDSNGNESRQMIVKFLSWRVREKVYKNRKLLENNRLYLDLTKRRLDLLNFAIDKVKDYEMVHFAFCDINCKLCLRLNNGQYKFFNSEEELCSLLDDLMSDVN
jgi:uncharacterized coiled-coil DUF342 family protein